MKNLIFALVLSFFSGFSAYADNCHSVGPTLLIQEDLKEAELFGIFSYGAHKKGDVVQIKDLIRNNLYTVQSDSAMVFSAHGQYFSGHFIYVYEIYPETCQILRTYEIYSE